jgi:ABC-2 type transport system ATP-binding protein
MKKAEIKSRTEELLALVGLEGENHRIKGFSRGMKQRLGIAQALFNRPKLLVCDEPTSALDPVGRKEILDVLLAARAETTVLFSTHILSDVEKICTDVAFLDRGKIQMQGKLSEVKSVYQRQSYVLETESPEEARVLSETFPEMRYDGSCRLQFEEAACDVSAVLRVLADRKISVIKLERQEPTLESLFMEVVER